MTLAMAGGFTSQAEQWWGIAAQWLGWRPSDFWHATPSELKGALSTPKVPQNVQGPSMIEIAEMMERESNG